MYPVPLTFSVKLALAAVTVAGAMLVAVGDGLLSGNRIWFEIPPPGAGVNTSTECEPARAMSGAVTEIRS